MPTTRQLAAVMFTDIVGYTALMGKDSKKALELISKSRQIQKPLVEKHNGKWLKEMGDGAMAQFSTALDAVDCAIDIQKLAKTEIDSKLRIGIHLGDIIVSENDVYGDGVNIASRIESITDPGGIYISESIEKAIRGQTNIKTKFLGEVQLKNVDYGVRTYALQGEGLPVPDIKEEQPSSGPLLAEMKGRDATRPRVLIMLMSIIVVAILAFVAYNKYWNNGAIDASIIERSIAVLPFENRSNLEEDEFFTNGIHDDLLTQISKIRNIKSIYSTSVEEYRNSTKNMRTIGEELDVATILIGGVARAGNQIRINVQLIDVITNELLLVETYTRVLNAENIFTIQSEIAKAIATALATVLSPEEKQDIDKFPTQNLAALEAYFQAKASDRKNTSEGSQEAINYLKDAVKLDSTFAIAYAKLGRLTLDKFWWAGLPIKEQIVKGKSFIEMAMQLDSTISEVQMANGYLKSYEKDVRKAELANYTDYEKDLHAIELAYQKAIDLNPNNATAYAAFGNFYLGLGNKAQGFEYLLKARELDPINDDLGIQLATKFRYIGRYDEARQIAEEIVARKPSYAAAYRVLANIAFHADQQLAECLRLSYKSYMYNPGFPMQSMHIGMTYDNIGDKKKASEWFSHGLNLSPDVVSSQLARGFIFEYRGEYNKAFDTYLKTEGPRANWVTQIAIFRLMELGLQTKRHSEVITHFQKVLPTLFQPDVRIDKNNFTAALAVGRLLKADGEREQADHLLKGSLKIARLEMFEVPLGTRNNNWECRVHLAMGNEDAALVSFIKFVEEGYHSDLIVRDPVYEPLYGKPEFRRSLEIMKTRLRKEQTIVKEMEARGELDIPSLPDN